jgi:hypothetical protein
MINLLDTKIWYLWQQSYCRLRPTQNDFLELTLALAIKLPKMSPNKTEWDTSQFAPKNLKRTDHCTCGHLVNFFIFLSSMHGKIDIYDMPNLKLSCICVCVVNHEMQSDKVVVT